MPSGAGTKATESRELASIYAKTSVVRIKNDDNACFWHALAVLMNKEHPEYRTNIRRGCSIRTTLAKELCEKCSMDWNEPVSVDSFEEIERILEFNLFFNQCCNHPSFKNNSQIIPLSDV